MVVTAPANLADEAAASSEPATATSATTDPVAAGSSSAGSSPAAETAEDLSEADLPPSFLCPIGGELMIDPVVCADGHSYERATIQRWFDSSTNLASPLAGAPLANRNLVPNHALRASIDEYLDKHATPQARASIEQRREFARAAEAQRRSADSATVQIALNPEEVRRENLRVQHQQGAMRHREELWRQLRAGLIYDLIAWGIVLTMSIRWLMVTSRWTWALATAQTLLIFYGVLSVCRKASRHGLVALHLVVFDAVAFSVGMTVIVFGGMGMFLEIQQALLRLLERPTPLANAAALFLVLNLLAMVALTLMRMRAIHRLGGVRAHVMLTRYGLLLILLALQQLAASVLLQVLDPCPPFTTPCTVSYNSSGTLL